MTKFLIYLIAIAPLVAFSQTNVKKRKTGELVIQGTISNFKEPVDYIYIICLDGNNDDKDSVPVIGNKYKISIQTGITTLITMYTKNPINPDNIKEKYMLTLVVEPTTVTVSSTDSFPHAKVSGSSAYLEYKLLETRAEPYRKQMSTLFNGLAKCEKAADKEGMAQFQKKIDSTLDKMYANV